MRLSAQLRLLAAAVLLAGAAQAGEIALDFDFAQARDYLGFGTQVWLKGDRGGGAGAKLGPKARAALAERSAQADSDDAAMQLLKELNARFVRVSMIPKIGLDELKPGLGVEQWLELLQRNDNPAQRERVAAFNARMKGLGIQPVLIFWRMPEPWTELRHQRAGSKQQGHLARPERVADYASLITAQMLWLKSQGVQPAAVELTNEPQGAWDTQYKREDYAALLLKTRAEMDRHGLQAWPIAGPGTGIPNFDHYIGGIVDAKATKALGYASAHVYLTPQVLADSSSAGMASFLGRGKFGPILITEFGVKKHNEDDPQVESDLDVASPEYGLQAATTALLLLGEGAGGLIYWQMQDFAWIKKPHGLLSAEGERRPVAYALKALFGSVPAGARAVGARSTRNDVAAVALMAGGKQYLMLVNRGGLAQSLTARLQGGSGGCTSVARIEAWSALGAEARSAVRNASAQAGNGACTLRAELQPGTVAAITVQ